MSAASFSLYLIDGERIVPRALRLVLAELDARFVAEDPRDLGTAGFERPGPWPEDDETWLWVDDADGREVGFADLPVIDRRRTLVRVWLAVEHRRSGLLTRAWTHWVDRYGEFDVAEPNATMQAFLKRQTEPLQLARARRFTSPRPR